MEEQDTGARGGDLNGTEEHDKAQHQEKETEAGEAQNQCEEQPKEEADDPKVESEDEGTGEELSESCEVPVDDKPVIKEQVAEESVEVHETECVAEEEKGEQVSIPDSEEVKESGKEESLDEPVNGVGEHLEEEQEANNKENHINGTSTKEENNHFEGEELTKEEEENNKNKEQEAGESVDFQKEEFTNNHDDDSHHTISELRSKWDSFGKEQSSPPIEHIHCHPGMADTAKSRFGGTAEKCNQCQKTVYAMERLEVAGRLMHKTCFRCCKCNSPLSVGRFSVGGGELYCMTHYKQAFREKGTYDVFTPDNPIKGKWQSKPAE
ncbi:hypothetical protein O3P69_020684 [Scylla paramamosain]|uniref:LIM zinc-binding domain-containing protein n=1 Tax=Scylla paramamosain TaxID=85552 RepID=A0AAW0TM96_SCYPA